jgi:23S rRNA pseudouridine1911/1915/1917 synthase
MYVGNVVAESGTIEGNGPSQRPYANGCFADSEIGKPAVTHYKVLERFGYVTLISASWKREEHIKFAFI